jgi:hypothetical protein
MRRPRKSSGVFWKYAHVCIKRISPFHCSIATLLYFSTHPPAPLPLSHTHLGLYPEEFLPPFFTSATLLTLPSPPTLLSHPPTPLLHPLHTLLPPPSHTLTPYTTRVPVLHSIPSPMLASKTPPELHTCAHLTAKFSLLACRFDGSLGLKSTHCVWRA